jgi:hypothetical protein
VGRQNPKRHASAAPPPRMKGEAPRAGSRSAPELLAVVETLRVAVPGAALVIVTGLVEPKVTVGRS